jgi:two-component system, chemotaxis family, protein-glutamate methylesterase/glutaminase
VANDSAAGRRGARVLIVDDSAVMRSLLRSVISAAAGLEVAGAAPDGESALTAISSLRPDLVLLDVEMPVMDGLVTLKRMRACGHRMPVIMCSSLTQRGARVTIEALANGASDYVAKPQNQAGRDAAMASLANELIPKIHALTQNSRPASAWAASPARPGILPPIFSPQSSQRLPSGPFAICVIGVSTGGPAALDNLLPALPSSFPLPVLIVQHMPEVFTGSLAERLNSSCRLRVREAGEGDPVRPGTIYIARGNWHLEVLASSRAGSPPSLHLTQGPPENHCRPAADVLFRSAASIYGGGVVALVLTGMGSDGLEGCRAVRARGGAVLAQDQATSAVWGMPGAVSQAGLAHRVLPLNQIAPEIVRLAGRPQVEASQPRESVV